MDGTKKKKTTSNGDPNLIEKISPCKIPNEKYTKHNKGRSIQHLQAQQAKGQSNV